MTKGTRSTYKLGLTRDVKVLVEGGFVAGPSDVDLFPQGPSTPPEVRGVLTSRRVTPSYFAGGPVPK